MMLPVMRIEVCMLLPTFRVIELLAPVFIIIDAVNITVSTIEGGRGGSVKPEFHNILGDTLDIFWAQKGNTECIYL